MCSAALLSGSACVEGNQSRDAHGLNLRSPCKSLFGALADLRRTFKHDDSEQSPSSPFRLSSALVKRSGTLPCAASVGDIGRACPTPHLPCRMRQVRREINHAFCRCDATPCFSASAWLGLFSDSPQSRFALKLVFTEHDWVFLRATHLSGVGRLRHVSGNRDWYIKQEPAQHNYTCLNGASLSEISAD